MNLSTIKRGAYRGLLILKKHSPEILTAVGVVGSVATTVLASRATLKAVPFVEEILMEIQETKRFGRLDDRETVRKLKKIYLRAVLGLAKFYGPSVTLGLASISSIIAAHGIMRKRNVALLAAYKAIESAFGEYRKRVIEEFGEDKDYDFRHGIYEQSVVDEETGKKKLVRVKDPNIHSVYAKIFDELNPNYEKNPEFNLIFLRAQQQYASDRLLAKGHLFLNEVYEALGFEHTQAGALVGWIVDKENDNFVDFNLYDLGSPKARDFINGFEKAIILDFNVDGIIFDKIP